MNIFGFSGKHSLVPKAQKQRIFHDLLPAIKNMEQIFQASYERPDSFITLPSDEKSLQQVMSLVNEKKQLQPVCMVVCGIGGSNLGTKAVYEALFGMFGNKKFLLYFADTVDSDYIKNLLDIVEKHLQANESILLTIISKSGSTTETIANFECFLMLLRSYYPQTYHQLVIAITDFNSPLWKIATENKFSTLTIPQQVPGRFSILSAVGLFPLACADVDIEKLCAGARIMNTHGLSLILENNEPAHSACIIAAQYANGIRIHDLFVFNIALESLGKWYRQLMAESLGKELDNEGKKIYAGITPTVSVGSTDLHSVGQLYLGGPYDKFTTFVTVECPLKTVTVPDYPEYQKLVPHIQKKSFATIMQAIFKGVQNAYTQNKRPYITTTLAQINEYYLGQWLQFKMIEISYLGNLLNVNTFDQPHVELYKTQTRKILANE